MLHWSIWFEHFLHRHNATNKPQYISNIQQIHYGRVFHTISSHMTATPWGPKVFSGQKETFHAFNMHCFSPGCFLSWIWPENTKWRPIPLDPREGKLFLTWFLKRLSPNTIEKKLISSACIYFFHFAWTEIMTIGVSLNIDWLVNPRFYLRAQLPLHNQALLLMHHIPNCWFSHS